MGVCGAGVLVPVPPRVLLVREGRAEGILEAGADVEVQV